MKHFKISAFKIAFLQFFHAKNKFGNQIQIETDDFKRDIYENGM